MGKYKSVFIPTSSLKKLTKNNKLFCFLLPSPTVTISIRPVYTNVFHSLCLSFRSHICKQNDNRNENSWSQTSASCLFCIKIKKSCRFRHKEQDWLVFPAAQVVRRVLLEVILLQIQQQEREPETNKNKQVP